MVDGVDFVDDVDTDKIHLKGCVHSVHSVHHPDMHVKEPALMRNLRYMSTKKVEFPAYMR
jgi:hypothetical protein